MLFSPAVKSRQAEAGSRDKYARLDGAGDEGGDALADSEAEFIRQRDSFYMATTGADGWPYLQHRGGPPGFIAVIDDHTLAFADFRGNLQYISVGNLDGDDRVSLFLMDYPNRRRLKILGHARVVATDENPELMARVSHADYKAVVERAVVIRIEAFDWNCPQHITPRFTEDEFARLNAT